jgi:hypothetical protein
MLHLFQTPSTMAVFPSSSFDMAGFYLEIQNRKPTSARAHTRSPLQAKVQALKRSQAQPRAQARGTACVTVSAADGEVRSRFSQARAKASRLLQGTPRFSSASESARGRRKRPLDAGRRTHLWSRVVRSAARRARSKGTAPGQPPCRPASLCWDVASVPCRRALRRRSRHRGPDGASVRAPAGRGY